MGKLFLYMSACVICYLCPPLGLLIVLAFYK